MSTGDTSGLTPPPGMEGVTVNPSGKERALGIAGAILNHGQPGFESTPLGKKIASVHASRMNEAAMHHQNMATYAGILTTGIDPATGNPLTDQKKSQYQDWYNLAKESFMKAGGVDKDSKDAVNKAAMFADAIIQHGQSKQQSAGAGASGTAPTSGGGAGLTPPPKAQTGSAEAAKSAQAPVTPSAPGSGSVPSSPAYNAQAQVDAPRLRQQIEDNRTFSNLKRIKDLEHQHKMEEALAVAKAKAQTGPRPRPVHSGSISILDARDQAARGQVFLGEDGEPIDLSKIDDSMGLYGMVVRGDDGKWETQYTLFSPNQRTVTAGNEIHAISPMDIHRITQGAGAYLGQHIVPTSSTHQAIAIGLGGEPVVNTLQSTSTPSTPGIPGRTQQPTNSATPRGGGLTPPPAAAPPAVGIGATGATRRGTPAKGGSAAIKGLPPGTYNQFQQRVTPVRLAATQLFGDPDQPSYKPLSSFGDIVDTPASRDRVATAWNLIRAHMDEAGVNPAQHGDLVNLMRNHFGTPGAVAESEVAKMEQTLDALKPREAEMLNRLFSTYGTVIGLRAITKGSAAKYSARNMEQEVPIPGMNVRTSKQFYDKLATLAEEVNNGWKGIPDMVLTPGEREFDKKAQEELSRKAGGRTSGRLPPPPGTGPMSADEFKRKHGIP